jgi:hypothetical protein
MKFIAAAALLFLVPQEQPALRPAGIAARINGEIITWDEVELEIRTTPMDQRTPEVRKATLKHLAEEALFLQEARVYGIDVSETQVDADLESKRRESRMTVERFQNWVNTEIQMSISEYRAKLRRQRTIATLMSRLATEPLRNPNPKLRLLLDFVSPEEMHDYYLRHPEQFKPIQQVDVVYLAFQFQTPAEQEEKLRLAQSIRRRVGEDSPLAIQALAHMDINLMQMQDGRRMPAYQNLAYEECPYGDDIKKLLYDTLKEGEVSDPVVDGNSIIIFQLKKKIVEKERTFEEAQPTIRRHLEQAKRRRNQKLLLEDLVRRSFVEPPDLFK